MTSVARAVRRYKDPLSGKRHEGGRRILGGPSPGIFAVAASAALLLYVGGVWDAAWEEGGPEGIKIASADAPVYPPIEGAPDFVAKFGTPGSGNGGFTDLGRVESNSTHLFVTQNDRHYVQIFHNNGTFAGMLGGQSGTDAAGGFDSPAGMAHNGTHLFVSDSRNMRVQIFDSSGQYVDHFGVRDGLAPVDVATVSSGIFVANDRTIQMYDSGGVYVKSLGNPRGAWDSSPSNVFSYVTAIGSNSTHLFVADAWDDRVMIFDSAGNYAAEFGARGSGDGQFRVPIDVTTVSNYVLVSDLSRDDIQIFDSAGSYVAKFGGDGSGDGQFLFVVSIVSNSTHLFALDRDRNDIQAFSFFEDGFAPNEPPELGPIGPQAVNEGETLTFNASATDGDAGQNLTYSVYSAPPGASFSPESGVFTWTPDESQGPGTYHVTVTATDDGPYPQSDSETVAILVSETNQPPALGPIGPRSVQVHSTLAIDLDSTDDDLPRTPLEYGSNATFGAIMDDTFLWTPTPDDVGTAVVRFTVSDQGLADHEDVEITVWSTPTESLRLAPIGPRSVSEGAELSFAAAPTDPAYLGQDLTYSIQNAPPGAAISPESGVFTWTPDESQGPGTYHVTVTVADGGPQSDSETVAILVNETNQPPALGPIGPKTATVGSHLVIVLSADDADVPSDTLAYLSNATLGALDRNIFSWAPTPDDVGTEVVRFTVHDGSVTDHEDVEITVSLTPSVPPVLDFIGPQSVKEGVTLTFNASATDENEWQSLTYSVQNAPPGAAISPESGVFTWTPDESQGPGTYYVTVTAADDGPYPKSDSETVAILVNETNQPPALGPIGPKTATVGSQLVIVLSADDADVPSDTLAYLSNATLGALDRNIFSWAPTPDDVGTEVVSFTVYDGSVTDHEDVVITVLPAP